ncbi:MAG: hypothetical protein JWO31_1743, partial [Phycisphaerales bacterium]|nr:hypothetical protein [Phycisphaerales bacterium]
MALSEPNGVPPGRGDSAGSPFAAAGFRAGWDDDPGPVDPPAGDEGRSADAAAA